MTHMTKDLDGICDMKDSLMRKVRGKNERRDWGGDMGSDGGTIQHGDMTTMTPDEQLNHLKMDVETMWRDATPEQRKRIKESLTKWSTTLTV